MQDLAEALEMHRGSLYHYIDSKEDLLWGIVLGVMSRFCDEVVPVLQRTGPPADRLRRGVRAHLRIAADAPDELTLAQVELKALGESRASEIIEMRDRYEHAWRGLIREGIQAGDFSCEDERSAGFVILAACNWFSQWFHSDGPMSVDEFAARFADLFLGALGAREAGAARAGTSVGSGRRRTTRP
jgi:AcrR family transcriptional regulator